MVYDSIIIGGGPAGLTVANNLEKEQIQYVVIEKGAIANHILQFPVFMRFFSSRELLELGNFPLTIPDEKPTRQQYLTYLNHFTKYRKLKIRTCTEVLAVNSQNGIFEVEIQNPNKTKEVLKAKTVVVAVGAYEKPKMLNVEGEDLPKVSHYFTETHPYFQKKVLVVGGRNSAVETALILYRSGADVSLSYRRKDFSESSIKYWMKPDIENRLKNDEIHWYPETNVTKIMYDKVLLSSRDGKEFLIDNDFVLCMTGYEPPLDFLKSIGIELDKETNVPLHNPTTLETRSIPGLFVVGVVTGGNISGKVFIENCRNHGDLVIKRLKEYI